MLPKIHEFQIEFVLDMFKRGCRYTDAVAIAQTFQTRGYVDAITIYPLLFHDHVSEIDTNPKAHFTIIGQRVVPGANLTLDDDRTLNGIDDACKFSQEVVAGGVDDAAVMLLD